MGTSKKPAEKQKSDGATDRAALSRWCGLDGLAVSDVSGERAGSRFEGVRKLFRGLSFGDITKLSDLGPPIPGKRIAVTRNGKSDLRQVSYHDPPVHAPLESEIEAQIIEFPRRE